MIDKDEFCEQIGIHQNAMYALAYSIVKNEQDACDIVGEAILRAYSGITSLKNKNAFRTWILRIVHNTAIDFLRKQENHISVEDIETYADNLSADNTDMATKIALHDAVNRLSQPYRTVIILFYYEGLSTARIAQITDTSIVAVRKQLHRARKQLKEYLSREVFIG
ncbi:MAG: sigma-70 family RNA polymerase sigma factor [Clostridia bacterium]|nr:sigma-70 family RNA polymerase sigma factor [Clostridia bacterium]